MAGSLMMLGIGLENKQVVQTKTIIENYYPNGLYNGSTTFFGAKTNAPGFCQK